MPIVFEMRKRRKETEIWNKYIDVWDQQKTHLISTCSLQRSGRERWKINEDFFFFGAFSIIYVNYYLDGYVLERKLWWINKQLSKSSIGCFTLQGILSLAFDTISAAGREFQSSKSWSIARRSKTPRRARQTKKSLWTCGIKSHLPLSAAPVQAGKLCPHFFLRSFHDKQMEPTASLFFTAMQLKSFQKT